MMSEEDSIYMKGSLGRGIYELLKRIHNEGLTVDLEASDIQIGAVEVKDHTTDDRVHVTSGKELLTTLPGVDSADNDGTDVGVVSTSVIDANPDRKFAVFVNDSAGVMYLGLGAAAVMGEGIRLNAQGGNYEINQTNLYTGEVTAIRGVGGGVRNLTHVEG